MKGFCSGSSIEIELELSQLEISRLMSETLTGSIRRGHEQPSKNVGIELLVGNVDDEPYMKLEIIPEGTDFESTTAYKITLSKSSYSMVKYGNGIVDRPKLGTKISIRKNRTI